MTSERRRLRLLIVAFFLALGIPTAILVRHANQQLRWEALHFQQQQAAELASQLRRALASAIAAEEARPSTDYSFLVVGGAPGRPFLAPSPLASWPPSAGLPGLLGHFQVDPDGRLRTPFTPASSDEAQRFGIDASQLRERQTLQARIAGMLSQDSMLAQAPPAQGDADRIEAEADADTADSAETRRDLGATLGAASAPAEAAAAAPPEPVTVRPARKQQAASLGKVADLKLAQNFQRARAKEQAAQPLLERDEASSVRSNRTLTESVASSAAADRLADAEEAPADVRSALRVRIFESEISPLRMRLLKDGHIVLYREVWRDQRRYVQGLVLERDALLQQFIEQPFLASSLARGTDLLLAWQGEVLAVYSSSRHTGYFAGDDVAGELLHDARLAAPLDEMELIFSLHSLPRPPGATVLYWLSATLLLVLCGGLVLLYRLGLRQIALTGQQQDFVAAVSHELKTPLTSIRMYGEMLHEGWAPADKQAQYYRFIRDEAERLSRLISNVLQLARIGRERSELNIEALPLEALRETLQSKLAPLTGASGFSLQLTLAPELEHRAVLCDADALLQIVINLVDNALKFAAKAPRRQIDLRLEAGAADRLQIAVRDYGPGVPREEAKRIFKLFHRVGSELTRDAPGTGIGLALVQQLAGAMNGSVALRHPEPGAEFVIDMPLERPDGQDGDFDRHAQNRAPTV